jgi:hypothetical protein
MPKSDFQKIVFSVAVAQAGKIRKQNPNLTVAEATKKAWKTKEVIAARAKYEATKAAKGKSKK